MAWNVVRGDLLKKMGREWDAYTRNIWNLPSHTVLGMSYEISAMRFCYHQISKHIREYGTEDLEWLLAYEKPLEALCTRWMAEQPVDFDTEFERFFCGCVYEEGSESSMDMISLS